MAASAQSRTIFVQAFKASLPILIGYGSMGFAAGVVFAARSGVGAPALWSGAIAAATLSGTLQFVICDWLAKDLPLATVAVLTLAISFRYALYGFSLLDRWRGAGIWRKLFLISGLADENYAIEASCRIADKKDYARFCTYLTALDIFYWFAGNLTGALAGSRLSIPGKGMEFVMAALFISVLTDQVRLLFKDFTAGRAAG